ncbi:MAG: GTP-binding protein [Candidatus Lokiarchaeota archaeon]|nr:GTP-binding protein [Candidatus Lokiarchaeota archaeon]
MTKIFHNWSQKEDNKRREEREKEENKYIPSHMKIVLIGLSGAGKTTLLTALCSSDSEAYELCLYGEGGSRSITEEEKKAWDTEADETSTSKFFNYGKLIITIDNNYNFYFYSEHRGVIENRDILITLFDTCGQAPYQELNTSQFGGADGAIFVLDAALPITKKRVLRILQVYTQIVKYFLEKEKKQIPILFICNKQDLKSAISSIMYRTTLKSYIIDIGPRIWNLFSNHKFLDTSALRNKESVKIALIKLIKEIITIQNIKETQTGLKTLFGDYKR